MPDMLQALLAGAAVPANELPRTSRYHGTPIGHYRMPGADPDGASVAFFGRRLCPHSFDLQPLYTYRVTAADQRRDLIAARQLGDPELWWKLADANDVIDPSTITEPVGRLLVIATQKAVGNA